MVRETRFSVEADEAFQLPGWRDGLWDLEDLDLSPPPPTRRGRPRKKSTGEAARGAGNRHLAAADWLEAEANSAPRERYSPGYAHTLPRE